MATSRKQQQINLQQHQRDRESANEARWLKLKRGSTDQSIMDAGRQPGDKPKEEKVSAKKPKDSV